MLSDNRFLPVALSEPQSGHSVTVAQEKRSHLVSRLELQRQLNSVVYHAQQSNLRDLIKSLLSARKAHDLDDEAFTKVMEVVLASYVENEVNAKVESLVNSIVRPATKKWFVGQ